MKYKLLVLDLDDTLLRQDLTISDENKEAIANAVNQGVHVVLGSGRAPIAMRKYINELELKDYGVAYNGAMVIRLENQKIIFQKSIEKEEAKSIFRHLKTFDLDIQTYIGNTLYVEEFKESTQKYCDITGMVAQVIDFEKDLKQDVVKILVAGEPKHLQRVKKEMEPFIQDKFHMFFSKPHYLEFTNIEANKGLAVAYLANYLGIKREEVICIGDNFNDTYMIQYAGLGVAVENAHEDVKKMANFITKSNMNNGVAHVIKKFIL